MTPNEKRLNDELEKIRQEVIIMREIATPKGFYSFYFKNLLQFSKNRECFNYVNDKYYEFFGEYKYSSYDSFKKLVTYYQKK